MVWDRIKSGVTGALGGAATGFTVGGPWGALAGAGLGGALGAFGDQPEEYAPDPNAARLQNGQAMRGYAGQMLMPAMTGRAITAPGAAAQEQLMQRLGQVSTGEQMGAGEMAARRQGATAVANQAGMAMGARGLGANAVAANAARNAGAIGTEVAGRAGEAAMGDQAQANALLGQVAGQNVGQSLQARGMDDAQAMAALDALYRMDLAEQQGRLGLEGYRQAAAAGQVGTAAQIANMGADMLPLLAQRNAAPQGTVPFRAVPASAYNAPKLGVMA